MDEGQPQRLKPSKLENFLSGCLAFVILIFVPIIVFSLALWISKQNYQPSILENPRQDALKENAKQFLERKKATGQQILIDNFELSLCPFASSDTWHDDPGPEEAGFICGYVTVPLDHSQPGGETIQIPIAIWPSYEEDARPDPLFITHGGPGGSALEFYPSYFYPDRVGGERDLVFVDQRGTRYAEPNLICPEVTEALYGSPNPEDGAYTYEYHEYLRYCRARLGGKGVDLSAFTTPQIARDFEVVRQTLGYGQINFYGVSYGTHVGQYLADDYPESIRSLILDGVAPIPLDYLNRDLSTKTRILNEIISSCEKDPDCAENYPDLAQRLSDLINSLDQDPAIVRLGLKYRFYPIELDGEFFYHYLLSEAYMDRNYAVLPYLIKEAESQRYDAFKNWLDWRISEMSRDGLNFFSVICSEHQPYTQAAADSVMIDFPIVAWENSDLEEMDQICQELGLQHDPETLQEMPRRFIPTLLLSGNFDPVTPPIYGEMALASFSQGQHLVDPLGSHGIAFMDDCINSILDDFLEDPSRDLNSTCLNDPTRREQVVPSGALASLFIREDLAWVFYGFPLLMATLTVLRYAFGGGRWLWRKIRKINAQGAKVEKRVRLKYELAHWVFTLSSLGLGFTLDHLQESLRDLPTYWRAIALPESDRIVLVIPFLLVLITPLFLTAVIRFWRNNSAVLLRVYLLLETLFCLIVSAVIILNEMLLIWVR
jgi:pimeloyl-ACP methyl ester carboxylesterase